MVATGGVTILALFRLFRDEEFSRRWMESVRWPVGPACPTCGSMNFSRTPSHRSMPYRCRDCRGYFSVRKGTVMEDSNLSLRQWAIGIYLASTRAKGISSPMLAKALGMTQKSAWFFLQRLREFFAGDVDIFRGPVEVDALHFSAFVSRRAKPGATLYTDDNVSYKPLAGRYKPLRVPVREGRRPHQRHRELLGPAQAGVQRRLPPHEPQAPAPLHQRVRRAP